MKNLTSFAFLVALTLLCGQPSIARFTGPSTVQEFKTVAQIKERPIDDVRVLLRGKIVEKVAHERYVFEDETGKILVEIGDKIFHRLPDVSSTTLVEIAGKIESGFGKLEVEVKFLKILEV